MLALPLWLMSFTSSTGEGMCNSRRGPAHDVPEHVPSPGLESQDMHADVQERETPAVQVVSWCGAVC
jgi:hypothetical protein